MKSTKRFLEIHSVQGKYVINNNYTENSIKNFNIEDRVVL
jgi:hypothetical protein